ncbi:uncharacterized protein LOC144770862 [Lissotriton helveticus]
MRGPTETAGGEKGVQGPQGGEAAEENRERFCQLKDEVEGQHWVISITMLALALLAVNDALWDSAHLPNKKALWKDVLLWVLRTVISKKSPKESDVPERFGMGEGSDDEGASAPLKGALCTLSAALMHLHNCDPLLSPPQRELESKPPLPTGSKLQECVHLCEALCGFRRKVSERLKVGDPGDLSDLNQELGVLTQRCEDQTDEVLSSGGLLEGTRGAGDKRGVMSYETRSRVSTGIGNTTRGATPEAPERTPETDGEPTLEEQSTTLMQTWPTTDARCDLPPEPQRSSSVSQAFWNTAFSWRMTTFLFFGLSVTGFTLLFVCLFCHTPPSSPSQIPKCCDDWMPSMNKYFWNQLETSWDMSSRLCVENGGRLAVLHDELKMDEIFKEYGRRYPWIGLSKPDEEFQWIDGFPFNANMTPVRGFGECAYLRKDGISLNECSMRRSSLCRREQYG